MKHLFRIHRTMLAILLIVAVLVTGLAGFLWPQLQLARATLYETRRAFLERNEQFGQSDVLRRFVARVDEARLADLYVAGDRPLDFIATLEALGQTASTTVELYPLQIKTSASAEGRNKSKKDKAPEAAIQGFEARLGGDFMAALTFLGGLEAMPKLFYIEDVLIQSVAERGKKTPGALRTIIQIHAPILQ